MSLVKLSRDNEDVEARPRAAGIRGREAPRPMGSPFINSPTYHMPGRRRGGRGLLARRGTRAEVARRRWDGLRRCCAARPPHPARAAGGQEIYFDRRNAASERAAAFDSVGAVLTHNDFVSPSHRGGDRLSCSRAGGGRGPAADNRYRRGGAASGGRGGCVRDAYKRGAARLMSSN